MELESKITNIKIPQNIRREFALSGLGGKGELVLTYGQNSQGANDFLYIHMDLTASVALIKNFHFEALATWEKTREGFSFVSYEEKEYTKKIFKKWEFGPDGLNFIENKKGLVLEREIQYLKTPDQQSNIFDPISAATLALLERPERDLCVFGKQRIMHIKTKKEIDGLRLIAVSGINERWVKILEDSRVRLDSKSAIETIEIVSPLKIGPVSIGKIKMQFKGEKNTDETQVENLVEKFREKIF